MDKHLPWELNTEYCESSSCPGFVVEWQTDWVARHTREVAVRDIGLMHLCDVCDDSADVCEDITESEWLDALRYLPR